MGSTSVLSARCVHFATLVMLMRCGGVFLSEEVYEFYLETLQPFPRITSDQGCHFHWEPETAL